MLSLRGSDSSKSRLGLLEEDHKGNACFYRHLGLCRLYSTRPKVGGAANRSLTAKLWRLIGTGGRPTAVSGYPFDSLYQDQTTMRLSEDRFSLGGSFVSSLAYLTRWLCSSAAGWAS